MRGKTDLEEISTIHNTSFHNVKYVNNTHFYLNKILMNSFHALNQIVFWDFVSERQTRCFFRRAYVTFSELIEQSPCGINARSGFYRSAQRGRARTRPPSPSPPPPRRVGQRKGCGGERLLLDWI